MNTPLSYSVTRWKDGGWQHIDDAVSPEEPVYVSWSGSSCRLWAWPDDLEPLAIGHVLLDRRHLGPEAGPSPFRMSGSVRAVSVPPGIDAKHAFAVELKRMEKKGHDETPSIVMTPDAIVKHMDAFLTLEGSCPLLWESTGCFHRCGDVRSQDPEPSSASPRTSGGTTASTRLAGWAASTASIRRKPCCSSRPASHPASTPRLAGRVSRSSSAAAPLPPRPWKWPGSKTGSIPPIP